MLSSSETKSDPADIGDGAPAVLRRGQHERRGTAVALVWPSTAPERERSFEKWESFAMNCLRSGRSDFSVIVALRKTLRSDGLVLATNAELSCAAGCSVTTLEIDLVKLKAASLIISSFHSLKGFSGRRRVIRLSLPS